MYEENFVCAIVIESKRHVTTRRWGGPDGFPSGRVTVRAATKRARRFLTNPRRRLSFDALDGTVRVPPTHLHVNRF